MFGHFPNTSNLSFSYNSGAVKSIVRIAQVVPKPVRTSGNFQEFTIKISYGQEKNISGKKRTSQSKSDFAGPAITNQNGKKLHS